MIALPLSADLERTGNSLFSFSPTCVETTIHIVSFLCSRCVNKTIRCRPKCWSDLQWKSVQWRPPRPPLPWDPHPLPPLPREIRGRAMNLRRSVVGLPLWLLVASAVQSLRMMTGQRLRSGYVLAPLAVIMWTAQQALLLPLPQPPQHPPLT